MTAAGEDMKSIWLHSSGAPICKEVERDAGPPNSLPQAENRLTFPPGQTAPQESNVELFRGRIQFANGRVDPFSLEPPEIIELQAEHGCRPFTIGESNFLIKWPSERVREMPRDRWLRRLLSCGR
jgi:hypothetical protein